MSKGRRNPKPAWGIHGLSQIFGDRRSIAAGLPDGRYVVAVSEPYDGNRLRASWEVLMGRAFALRWPEPGELEDAIGLNPLEPKRP